MEKVRIGVIGCVKMGQRHIKLVQNHPRAEVVAVADVVDERARRLAGEFGIAAVHKNEDDLLSDERVDAVILAMPTGVRTPVALKALAQGEHVLLEKPVASSADEVERMTADAGQRLCDAS